VALSAGKLNLRASALLCSFSRAVSDFGMSSSFAAGSHGRGSSGSRRESKGSCKCSVKCLSSETKQHKMENVGHPAS
jgi:hypothetical protein